MRVAFLTPSNIAGGAERVLSILANAFSDRGIETYFICFDEDSKFYNLNSNIFEIYLGINSKSKRGVLKYALFYQYYRRIKEKLVSIKPDIVISFLFLTNTVGIACCKKLGIPIILSERNDPTRYSLKQKILMKIFYDKADGFVCQSKIVKNFMEKVYGIKNAVVIANPITNEQIGEPCLAKQKKIISVGRLIEQKNHTVLIKAFSKVSDMFPKYKLYIYGEGELRNKLNSLIKETGLEEKVFLPGVGKEILKNNNDAQLFILPSNYEGFPNVLIEAMCNGIPSIASDVKSGTVREIINEKNGFTFPPGDVNALANLIMISLKNLEILNSMGSNGLKLIEEYSVDRIIDKWIKYINFIISR